MSERPTYLRDPYLAELSTEILSVGEAEGRPFAIPRDTVLYPEGGGQPADHGWLDGVPVTDVRRGEDGIRHFLESPVTPGPAELKLDWARRYDHMQQHTAQHLLSAIAASEHGWTTTSFHLGARQCDIELDAAELDPEAIAALEERLAAEIRAARAVTARWLSPEDYAELALRTRGLPEGFAGDVRLVEIEGIDLTTCGGTHLRSTAEIEILRLAGTEPMRGGTRLHWLAGGRVRRRLEELEERDSELRLLFETSGEELVTTATTRLGALKESNRQLRRLEGELAEARAASLATAPESVVEAHFDGVDAGFLQKLAREVLGSAPDKCLLLTSSSDKGDFFVLACGAESGVDASETGPAVAAALEGRGGGSGAIYQGKAGSLEGRPEALSQLESRLKAG